MRIHAHSAKQHVHLHVHLPFEAVLNARRGARQHRLASRLDRVHHSLGLGGSVLLRVGVGVALDVRVLRRVHWRTLLRRRRVRGVVLCWRRV